MIRYINKSKVSFILFTNQLVLLFSILLFCSSCFENIRDQVKKIDKYKQSIDLEKLEIILNKDVLSCENKNDYFTNAINKEKLIKKSKSDSDINIEKSQRIKRKQAQESSNQKRKIEVICLAQSMQSLGSHIQEDHQLRVPIEEEISQDEAFSREVEARIREQLGIQNQLNSKEGEMFIEHLHSELAADNQIEEEEKKNIPQDHNAEKDIQYLYIEPELEKTESALEKQECNICTNPFSETNIKRQLACCDNKQSVCHSCFNKLSNCPYCRKGLN